MIYFTPIFLKPGKRPSGGDFSEFRREYRKQSSERKTILLVLLLILPYVYYSHIPQRARLVYVLHNNILILLELLYEHVFNVVITDD